MKDLGLPISMDTRLVIIRSRFQHIKNLKCGYCHQTRHTDRTRHFLRRRIDRATGSETRFYECCHCGHRVPA